MSCKWQLAQANLFLNNAALGGAGVTFSSVILSRTLSFTDISPLLIRKMWIEIKPGATNTVNYLPDQTTLQFQVNYGPQPTVLKNTLRAVTGGGGGTSYIFDAIQFSLSPNYAGRLELNSPIENATQIILQQFNTGWSAATAITDQLNVLLNFEFRLMN